MGVWEFRKEIFYCLHCRKHLPWAKWDLDVTRCLHMPQETSQENWSLMSDMTCSGAPKWTDGFAARLFLSSPLLQLKWCWITWKTRQVLRNKHFFDRSHSPVRRDLSCLSTIQMSNSADDNNRSIGLVLAQAQISYFLAICHSCLFRQVTKSWIRSLATFSNTLVFLILPVQAIPMSPVALMQGWNFQLSYLSPTLLKWLSSLDVRPVRCSGCPGWLGNYFDRVWNKGKRVSVSIFPDSYLLMLCLPMAHGDTRN